MQRHPRQSRLDPSILQPDLPFNGCPHRRVEFRKVPGSRLAVLCCRDCPHQESISMAQAFQRICEAAEFG